MNQMGRRFVASPRVPGKFSSRVIPRFSSSMIADYDQLNRLTDDVTGVLFTSALSYVTIAFHRAVDQRY
jgi:hypothetical protein